eukprot:g7777.t1
MASFGLDLDSPLLPNVDRYINPTKDEDEHRSALNAVVVNIHRAGAGAFEGLVANNLGEYLSNSDAKIRERATLLLAELLARLPKLPLTAASAARFAAFFSARLGDYPSVVPALKALSGLLKNHSPALLGADRAAPPPAASAVPAAAAVAAAAAAAAAPGAGAEGGAGAGGRGAPGGDPSAAVVIARGVFDELHLPALSQSIRQAALSVLLALVTDPGLVEAVSSGMGKAFVTGLVGSLEGEKDPRCLIVGLSALRKTQAGFDSTALLDTCEQVFDATACYFPVTFTPPPNDPHNISPDALRTGLEGVLVGSPGMAPHVLPMLLDKLGSEVSTAKEASLRALVAGIRAFGTPGVGKHLRAIGAAMFEEAVHGSDPDLASLALQSLTEVVREAASHAALTGEGDACPEWRDVAQPILEVAVAEVTGAQPCSVLGRGSTKVLLALAASSALGFRSALSLAVPRLLRARKEAAAVMERQVAALGAASAGGGCCGGGGGEAAGGTATGGGGGGCCGSGGGAGGGEAPSLADTEALGDAQAAWLGALAGLTAAVDDKVDFSGSQAGAPLQPFVAPLLAEFTAALDACTINTVGGAPSLCEEEKPPPPPPPPSPSPAATATVSLAARGLADVIARPPAALVGQEDVDGVVGKLVAVLGEPRAWRGGLGVGVGEGEGGEEASAGGVWVGEGTAAFAVLSALRRIGLRRPEHARAVLDTAVPPLLEQLRQLSPPFAVEGEVSAAAAAAAATDRAHASLPTAGRAGGGGGGTVVRAGRACSALVELSEIPCVFATAVSALLAAATSQAGRGGGGDCSETAATPVLLGTPAAEAALKALDDALKRGAKCGHGHEAAMLGFIRGDAPSSESAPAGGAAGDGGGEEQGPWGLPLMLAALDSASPYFTAKRNSSVERRSPGSGLSQSAFGAVISAVRTCTVAAPPGDQESLLSSLFSRILPRPPAAGGGGGGEDSDAAAAAEEESGRDAGGGTRTMEKHAGLLPALAAVIGAVSLDLAALGPGGGAAAAVPALLSASLAEGSTGLVETTREGGDGAGGPAAAGGSGGGRGRSASGGGGAASASSASCCQCLAAVLNKLATGPELDAAVALVVEALQAAFAGEGVGGTAGGGDEGAMDVDGAESKMGRGEEVGGEGPLQCLAWTVKAVAMRGGLLGAFSDLLDLLCGLLTTATPATGGRPNTRGLAAAAAFGIALGQNGEGLRTDDGGGGGGAGAGGGGARVSPLWRQRFFVKTFPKLLAASRGPAAAAAAAGAQPGAPPADSSSSDDDDMVQTTSVPPHHHGGEKGDGSGPSSCSKGKGAAAVTDREPALLALLRVVRGVPPEVLAQELSTAVSAVVQALRSAYPPLQAEALETFQVLSKNGMAAFYQHLSSVIPLLLSIAEGQGGGFGVGRAGGGGGRTARSPGTGGDAMSRFRAVQCLTALTALPYSRLHPFKTQVTRRLRGPLDDDRRAVRQAAAEARNIWARAAWADHAGPTEVYVQDRMRQLRSAGVKGDFGLYEGYSPPDYTMGPDHSGRPPLEGGALHQLVSAPGEAQNLHQDPRQATSSLRLGPTPAHHQRGWRSADFAHLPPASAGSADTAISSPFTASVPHLRRHSDGSAMFPSSSVSALEGEAATSRYTDSDGVGLVSGSGGASAYSDHRRGSRGPSGWGPYPGPEPTTSGLVPWAGVSRGPNRSRAEYGEGGDAGSQPTGFRLQSLDDHLYHQYRLQPTATRAKRLGDAADDSEMAGLLGLPASEPLEAGTGYNQLGTTPVLDEVGGAEIDGQFYSSLGVNGLSRQSHGAVAAGSPSQNMGSGGRRSAEVRPRQHGAGLALLGLVGGRWPSEGGGHSSGPAADSDEGYGRELYQGNGRQHDSSAQRQHQHHASQLMGQQQQGQHTPPTSMLPPVAGSYSAASRPLLAGTAHSVRSSYPWPGLPEAVATPGGQAPGIDVGSIFGDMPDNSGRHGDVNNTAGIVGGIPGAVTGEGKMGQRR